MFSHDKGLTAVVPNAARNPMTPTEALAYFDSLDPVDIDTMIGDWRGAELSTGHAMDGMLVATRWFGKSFQSAEVVHPLVHTGLTGGQYCVNPAMLPMKLGLRLTWLQPVAPLLFGLLQPILATRAPKARLRMMEYRGKTSATMIYDAKPIHDVFRKIDDDTVLGLMDHRGDAHPFYFTLTRL
jgi:hypothetical protein